jgi:hypothetical protein
VKASIGFQILNQKQPVLVLSETLLRSIQHLVARSELEAQWFHTVVRAEDEKRIYFVLDHLLIPKQYVSGAFVETPPEFQVEYWQELVSKFGGAEQASEIIKTSGAWCHSHVNMAACPSGTDDTTFKAHCAEAHATQNPTPQLMLIFNKKDEYFSRVWDPVSGLVYEGLEMILTSNEDWTTFNQEMDGKFLKQAPEPLKTPHFTQRPLPTNTNGGGQSAGSSNKSPKKASPIEFSRADYSKFFDLLEKYVADGLAEDLNLIREMVDKYLSKYYIRSLAEMSFGSVPDIRRLATRYFTTKDFYQQNGERDLERFWGRILKRDYSVERVVMAMDRTVDLASSDTYIYAQEVINGFLVDGNLIEESKSPHTRVDVSEWGPK